MEFWKVEMPCSNVKKKVLRVLDVESKAAHTVFYAIFFVKFSEKKHEVRQSTNPATFSPLISCPFTKMS